MIKKTIKTYVYAFINPVTNDLRTRVFIGSKLTKEELKKVAADYEADWGVEEVVTAFVSSPKVTYAMPLQEFIETATIVDE